jgi:hypothetical protein
LRGFFHGGPMAHCGFQNPSKPLRFKSALTGRFAGMGKAINIEALPTNLGVKSSNLFGAPVFSNFARHSHGVTDTFHDGAVDAYNKRAPLPFAGFESLPFDFRVCENRRHSLRTVSFTMGSA